MKTAFAAWENRIAPVFDVAPTILFVEDDAGRVLRETREHLPAGAAAQKALRLAEFEVDTLVCGAISRSLEMMITAYGIRVVAFVSGDVREIVQAFLAGGLTAKRYGMPGCAARRKRPHGQDGANTYQQEVLMVGGNSGNQGGKGQGGGRGQGRGGAQGGRKGGGAAGPQGFCVCPQCGQRETHERGVPCYERKCPQCGAAMIRE